MYFLLDANLAAGYYLPRSLNSKKASERIRIIIDSIRSGRTEAFIYMPNFCIAEVFSVFMKYSFGQWNRHVKSKGTIDTRVYNSLVKQFQKDIHNGKFIYHLELNRYHVLGINLVAPIDHYFQISKTKAVPMSAFDQLVISMGVNLAHIHGSENVCILSADDRLTTILTKCKTRIPVKTIHKLKLSIAEEVTGRPFSPEIFPKHLNLKSAKNNELQAIFGKWPLEIDSITDKPYRWTR
jgi:hypothetical protein